MGEFRVKPVPMARLDALLARNLGWSRARARAAITDGLVRSADGPALVDPRADIAADALPLPISVEGSAVSVLHDSVTLMLNKPIGVVTALRDARHPTAYALLRQAPLADELRPAGRLDLDTSGLLLWTTEGAYLQRWTHPKRAVPRTYQAALARPFRAPPPDFVLEDGHRPSLASLELIPSAAAHPALLVPPGTAELATITLTGGAYHEVRRIFAALGSHVLGLCRVGFGQLALPADLEPGDYRLVDPRAI
jgi:16S rRNA pseudouridine516 synthase